MAGEHPVEAHTYQLNDHERRLRDLEDQVQEMQIVLSASEEKTKTIFKVLDEVKVLLEKYTTEMRKAMMDLATAFNTRMDTLEKDVKELQGRPARKWDTMVQGAITAIVGLLIGYLWGKIQNGGK